MFAVLSQVLKTQVARVCSPARTVWARSYGIGTFTSLNPNTESYSLGQAFLHSKFGYRGVIIGGWKADVGHQLQPTSPRGRRMSGKKPPVQCAVTSMDAMFMYQVVCHRGDVETDTTHKVLPATMSWCPALGDVIRGVDIVRHSDVLPYTPDTPRQFNSYPFPMQNSKQRSDGDNDNGRGGDHGGDHRRRSNGGSGGDVNISTLLERPRKNASGLFKDLFAFIFTPKLMKYPQILHTDVGYWWHQASSTCFDGVDVAIATCDNVGVEISMVAFKAHSVMSLASSVEHPLTTARAFKEHVTLLNGDRSRRELELKCDVHGVGHPWVWAVQTRVSLKGRRSVNLLRHRYTTRDDVGRSNTTRTTIDREYALLTPESPSMQYTMLCSMATPSGRLVGEFELKVDGEPDVQVAGAPDTVLQS